MQSLVNCALNLGRLFNQCQRRANGSVLLAFSDWKIGGAAQPLGIVLNDLDQPEKSGADILVWERSHAVRNTACRAIDRYAASRWHPEFIGELPGQLLQNDKAWEVGEHAGVQHLTPSCRQSRRGIAENVDQTNPVNAQSFHKRIADKILARQTRLVVFFPVAVDFQNLPRILVDRYPIRQRDGFALELPGSVLIQVPFAIAFIQRVRLILRPLIYRGPDAFDAVFLVFDLVLGCRWLSERDIPIHLQKLHALHHGRSHGHAMGHATGIPQIGRSVGNNQVISVDRFGYRTAADRTRIDLLPTRTSEHRPEQHTLGVWVVFRSYVSQIMVEFGLEGFRDLIALFRFLSDILDFDRTIGRE